MNILVVGYKGFIGNYLYNFFKIFYYLRGITRVGAKKQYKSLIKKNFTPDVVIHCAGTGLVGISEISSKIHFQKNCNSTRQLINFIKKKKLKDKLIIYLSSQAVYNPKSNTIRENNKIKPISYYGKSKYLSENLLKKIKNNYILILRLFSVYGVGLKKQILWDACNKFKNSDKVYFKGNGNEKRDFINIKDISNLVDLILKKNEYKKFSIYNVGSGSGVKISELIYKLKKIYNYKKNIFFNGKSNYIENKDYVSDISKVKKDFNWKPKSKFKIELKKYVKWFKKI